MLLTVTYPVLPKRNSVRASLVMDHFGISHDTHEHVLARDLEVPLQSGDVVLFTGASGSGKSSLLKAVLRQLSEVSQSVGGNSPRRHGGTERNGVEKSVIEPQEGNLPVAVLCPLSPAIDIRSTGGCVAGERAGVRGPRRSPPPPHPALLPHGGVGFESRIDCGGEGTETKNSCQLANAPKPQLSHSLMELSSLTDSPSVPPW